MKKGLILKIVTLIVAVAAALGICSTELLDELLAFQNGFSENGGAFADEITEFEVHYIDVGQGDSILIMSGGEYMLIDGGPSSASEKVYAYLEKYGIDDLDYVVCTHAHEDHVGGLSGALNYAAAETVFCPVTEYDSRAFRSFKKYLGEQGVSITIPKVGDTYSLGEAEFEILSPEYIDEKDTNNTSIVIRMEYGETSFIFTGDAETESENYILDEGFEIRSDVLKVGHHGSVTSTSDDFLWEVAPDYAVISAAKGNDYGHPHRETLEKLEKAGVEIFRTDLEGDIICRSDGKNLSFETTK